MVPGPGRTNSPPFSEVFGYNPSVSSPYRLAESEGISTSGAESWCPTDRVPGHQSTAPALPPQILLQLHKHKQLLGGGGILKWETEKAFVPSPYSETAGTPYLLIPPISWPWNEGRENSSSLTSGGSKNVSLTYIAATSVQCGVLGRMWTPTFQGGMNFKNGWQVLSWKSGGGVQEKVS